MRIASRSANVFLHDSAAGRHECTAVFSLKMLAARTKTTAAAFAATIHIEVDRHIALIRHVTTSLHDHAVRVILHFNADDFGQERRCQPKVSSISSRVLVYILEARLSH